MQRLGINGVWRMCCVVCAVFMLIGCGEADEPQDKVSTDTEASPNNVDDTPGPDEANNDDTPGPDEANNNDELDDTPSEPDELNFSFVHKSILLDNGCFACHGAQGPGGGLRLDDEDLAYEALFKPSLCDVDTELVEPGNPENSLLWQKVASTATSVCGDKMPPGLNGINDDQSSLLYQWIEQGALR